MSNSCKIIHHPIYLKGTCLNTTTHTRNSIRVILSMCLRVEMCSFLNKLVVNYFPIIIPIGLYNNVNFSLMGCHK